MSNWKFKEHFPHFPGERFISYNAHFYGKFYDSKKF